MPETLLSNDPLRSLGTTYSGAELQSQITARLQKRFNAFYTESEITDVAEHPFRLFPNWFILTEEATRVFRSLARHCRFELKPPRLIASHRKYIGPAIVFIKRLTFPLVKFQMKDAMATQTFFNISVIKQLAAQHVELERRPALEEE
jgi:hypothetical protein